MTSQSYTTPHSCEHCQKIVLTRPDDDPELEMVRSPERSLLLSKILRNVKPNTWDMERLQEGFLFEIDNDELAKYVEDGCLFYTFILARLKDFYKSNFKDNREMKAYLSKMIHKTPHGTEWLIPKCQMVVVVRLGTASVDFKVVLNLSRKPRNELHFLYLGSSFAVFAQEGDLAHEQFRPTASTHIRSEESFSVSRSWLEHCVQNHPQCTPQTRGFCPTRLIMISRQQSRRVLQLKENCEQGTRYAALSYCWGGEQEVKTTRQNLEHHLTVINFWDLPPTLADAIEVTDRMGLEYLWVDALCIIQDDNDDQAREIDDMGSVYESATFTILASRAQRVSEGFLQDLIQYGKGLPDAVFRMKYRPTLSNDINYITLAPTQNRFSPDHLSERGWAYQEHQFSNRVLKFSSTCVHWSCHITEECDRVGVKCTIWPQRSGVRAGHNQSASVYDAGLTDWYKDWCTDLTNYTPKSLTLPNDRLRAIGGIAKWYSLRNRDEYLAGLWRSKLAQGLLWSKTLPDARNLSAPTWSWASITGEIDDLHFDHSSGIKIQVLDVEMKYPNSETRFGLTTSGRLTIRGCITPVDWVVIARTYDLKFKDISETSETSISKYIGTNVDCWNTGMENGNRLRIYLLVVAATAHDTQVMGLMLHKHSDGMYSRLGRFTFPAYREDEYRVPHLVHQFLNRTPQDIAII